MSISIGLHDHTALVTGAGQGIGREIALTLARAGARVGVNDVVAERAEAVAAEIRGAGGAARAVAADVTERTAVGAMLDHIDRHLGTVDVLVNNADHWTIGPFLESDPAAWERDIRVCLFGSLNCAHAALERMCERGWGRIVSIVSDAARVGEPDQVAYAAAKAGVIGMTKSLAREVGRRGVTVNCVSPGTTLADDAPLGADDALVQRMARRYPTGRLGRASDVAAAVLYLTSDLASHVTGQVLSVSGGYTMAG
ncbi:MAG: SDR family NAD(P)-dependent oxidoreductase [Thermodesulfobacteriota bacterium]